MIAGTCLIFLALDSSKGQVLSLFVLSLVSHKTLLQQLILQALRFCFGFLGINGSEAVCQVSVETGVADPI